MKIKFETSTERSKALKYYISKIETRCDEVSKLPNPNIEILDKLKDYKNLWEELLEKCNEIEKSGATDSNKKFQFKEII